MKKYRLDLILQAAEFFAQEESVVENFEHDLRYMQSQFDKSKPEDVKEINSFTLISEISSYKEFVITDILLKYDEILKAD